MVRIGGLRVIIIVTGYTGRRRIGIVPLVTFIAGQGHMCALNRIEAVVKCGGRPDRL